MTEPELLDAAAPAEAFTALADGTRVDILQALWTADESVCSFSDLREAVGMRDSGQFNYHLDKLRGRFLRKTEDGYELTLAGTRIVGAIHTGAITMEGTMEPMALDEACPICGGQRTFRYERERARIDCDGCQAQMEAGIPPGVFEGYDREEIPAVAMRYVRLNIQYVDRGFCNQCDGRMDPTLLPASGLTSGVEDPPAEFRDIPMVEFECRRCGATLQSDLGALLLDHPRVAGFHEDHGLDVQGPDWWQYSVFVPERARFVDDDYERAALTFALGDETLRVEVDGDLEVRDIEREES